MRTPGSVARARFGVVVPVKPTAVGKSRLRPLGEDLRRALVTAFALDTVSAVRSCPAVAATLVVTDDATLAGAMDRLGISSAPDGRPGSLNESLRLGAETLMCRHPGLIPVAVCADLPALTAAHLGDVLQAALQGGFHPACRVAPDSNRPASPDHPAGAPAGSSAFVADAAGSGTTLYLAPTLEGFWPHFGPRSRAAHLAGGATSLEAADTVRQDVDTPEDLERAAALGVGVATSSVLARLRR